MKGAGRRGQSACTEGSRSRCPRTSSVCQEGCARRGVDPSSLADPSSSIPGSRSGFLVCKRSGGASRPNLWFDLRTACCCCCCWFFFFFLELFYIHNKIETKVQKISICLLLDLRFNNWIYDPAFPLPVICWYLSCGIMRGISRVRLFTASGTVACQAPLSLESFFKSGILKTVAFSYSSWYLRVALKRIQEWKNKQKQKETIQEKARTKILLQDHKQQYCIYK